jgi:DNA-binding response OmpR family regulator
VVKRPHIRNTVRIHKFIISVGSLPEFLWLREAVLRNAGFQVLTIVNEKDALTKIETIHCGVLLLCYSVDEKTMKQLTKKYRKARPDGRIVAITNASLQHPP